MIGLEELAKAIGTSFVICMLGDGFLRLFQIKACLRIE